MDFKKKVTSYRPVNLTKNWFAHIWNIHNFFCCRGGRYRSVLQANHQFRSFMCRFTLTYIVSNTVHMNDKLSRNCFLNLHIPWYIDMPWLNFLLQLHTNSKMCPIGIRLNSWKIDPILMLFFLRHSLQYLKKTLY